MRVSIEKETNKIIEMQSHATEGTLIQNALNMGYEEADIEERVVTQEEYDALIELQPKPPESNEPTLEDRLNELQSTIDVLLGGVSDDTEVV